VNLRRQLLLVSLLTLVLPWAGCQFIRETETALREGQQRMLSGTAQAIADSLSQFPSEFLAAGTDGTFRDSQIFGHSLVNEPFIDGYIDDWSLSEESIRTLPGNEGAIRFSFGVFGQYVYLFVEARDSTVIYAAAPSAAGDAFFEHIDLLSIDAVGTRSEFTFRPEAPGALFGQRLVEGEVKEESRIQAHWQDTPSGYRLEARIPRQLLGVFLGLSVTNTRSASSPGITRSSYQGSTPGRFITTSPILTSAVNGYAQSDLRLIVTDRAGWRLAQAGQLGDTRGGGAEAGDLGWMHRAYNALLEQGDDAVLAEPHPSGREQQAYLRRALEAEAASAWFRSAQSGRAVIAVARPIWSGNVQTGALVLQQGTDAILSLTNKSLGRLINFTLIATLGVGLVLLGYASWLSLRVRRLSAAAERALDEDATQLALPSANASDEIGDLSRSFSQVLRQLGNYNEYLRTLASKLSHELRTPLTIVKSSLENLEHEPLTDDARQYTARARDGAARLQKILSAMSEASRVEELMQNAEPEAIDIHDALQSATAAYAGAWPERRFRFEASMDVAPFSGSPEMIMQMLDKLVDNAIGFSGKQDEIVISLETKGDQYRLSVANPGPPLPDRMRTQLFDSMVSVREGPGYEHLGLGLYIAMLIAKGHGGTIRAENTHEGVVFHIYLPINQTENNRA